MTRRSSTSSSALARRSTVLRVEHVAQAVAEQVEAEADDEDGDARHGRHPPLVEDEARPAEIIAPHSGSGGCAPRPRKPRPAAVRMMPAMSSVRRTITEDRHIGTMWRSMMRAGRGALQLDRRDVVGLARWSASRPARGAHRAARGERDGDDGVLRCPGRARPRRPAPGSASGRTGRCR